MTIGETAETITYIDAIFNRSKQRLQPLATILTRIFYLDNTEH